MTPIDLVLNYPFLQRALLAALVVAALSGLLGIYVVLRGLSLIGDGLAHISFAGVALGLSLGLYPLAFALGFAIVGALLIQALRASGKVRGDTAIGILFTAGLAFGIIIISKQKGFSVDLTTYLFGNILAVTNADLILVAAVALGLLVVFALLRKEFFYVTFSEEAARLSGLPVGALNVLFTALTAATIVVAARLVGVLLVSALLIVPAATSLQFARSFRFALVLSVLVGLASVLIGLYVAIAYGLATGASIALASAMLFGLALGGKALAMRLRAVA